MNEEEKYNSLINRMGENLAKRYVLVKIAHWQGDEFVEVRTDTEQYWQNVLSYFK